MGSDRQLPSFVPLVLVVPIPTPLYLILILVCFVISLLVVLCFISEDLNSRSALCHARER
jgi:hypothetical protein